MVQPHLYFPSVLGTPAYFQVGDGMYAGSNPPQRALDVVEAGEGDAGGHGALHEVHGEPLVQAPHHSLLSAT